MRHYRRLTASEIATLDGATEYERLASICAVRVGESGGRVVADVRGGDDPALPGEFAGATLADLHAATRPNVAEAEYTVTDPETDVVTTGRTKVADVPEGATVTATDLSPHEWA